MFFGVPNLIRISEKDYFFWNHRPFKNLWITGLLILTRNPTLDLGLISSSDYGFSLEILMLPLNEHSSSSSSSSPFLSHFYVYKSIQFTSRILLILCITVFLKLILRPNLFIYRLMVVVATDSYIKMWKPTVKVTLK